MESEFYLWDKMTLDSNGSPGIGNQLAYDLMRLERKVIKTLKNMDKLNNRSRKSLGFLTQFTEINKRIYQSISTLKLMIHSILGQNFEEIHNWHGII